MSDVPEAEVRRAQQGDRAAIEAIVRAFLPRVHGLCLRLTRRADLAEEAAQETFVRALRALPDLRDPARLDSWMLAIAANAARVLLRRGAREPSLQHDPPAVDPVVDDEAQTRRGALERAVADLPAPERELFLMHTVEGVRLADLARAHRQTESALRARVHRIRIKVRARVVAHLEAAAAGAQP